MKAPKKISTLRAFFDYMEYRLRRGWTQGKFRDRAGRVCLLGAMTSAYLKSEPAVSNRLQTVARRRIERAIEARCGCLRNTALWNDEPSRTKADVLDLVGEARRIRVSA